MDGALDFPRDASGRIVGYAIGREERLREVIYVCERCSATWCPVPWRRARADARYCSQRCQHAAWRERTGVRS